LSIPLVVASIALTYLWWRRLGSSGRTCAVIAVVLALIGTAFLPVRLVMMLPARNWGL